MDRSRSLAQIADDILSYDGDQAPISDAGSDAKFIIAAIRKQINMSDEFLLTELERFLSNYGKPTKQDAIALKGILEDRLNKPTS